MKSTLSEAYHAFKTPETDGRRIGWVRSVSAILGGLFVAYLGMSVPATLIAGSPGEALIIPLLFNTLAWACAALWIFMAPSPRGALLRALIPTLILGAALAAMLP